MTRTGMDYPHGTYLAYMHRPCRCQDCRTAWNVYQQKLQSRHRRGDVWADGDRYRRLLAPFLSADVTPTAIYRATGLRPQAVRDLMHGTGRVRKGPASRLDGLSWDMLDDATHVSADLLRDVISELRERGVVQEHMARRLGWSGWPGPDYPKGRRVELGTVRELRRMLSEVSSPACEDCGGEPLAGGRWCLDCFNLRSLPQSRRDVEVAARRERARLAKRQSRSAA